MKIYTRAGDSGKSFLLGKEKYPKDSIIFETLGSLDELNAFLGLLHASRQKEVKKIIGEIQSDLFYLGSLIANPKSTAKEFEEFKNKTKVLESYIDRYTDKLPELKNFILPGGLKNAANLHLARAISRRVERNIVALSKLENYNKLDNIFPYINRLSDLLFVLARFINYNLGVKDIIWKGKNA